MHTFKSYQQCLLTTLAALLLIATVSWIYKNSYPSCQLQVNTPVQTTERTFKRTNEHNKLNEHNERTNEPSNLIIQRKENIPCADLYTLFRDINFDHPTVKQSVCKNSIAYSLKNHVFPPCQLGEKFQFDKKHKFTQTKLRIQGKGNFITIFTYSKMDHLISKSIMTDGVFEGKQVRVFFDLVTKYSDISFLDIGSNVGIYALHAAFYRIPVVALDANLRNLVRLRRSAKANNYNVTLLWNFIGDTPGIEYLNFYPDCNVGGAHHHRSIESASHIKDTVPVMKITSDQLKPFVKTSKLAIKLDIQGGETNFFRHAANLFKEFNIPVVQMEFLYRDKFVSEENGKFLLDFFKARGYKPIDAITNKALTMQSWKSWYDVIWVKA